MSVIRRLDPGPGLPVRASAHPPRRRGPAGWRSRTSRPTSRWRRTARSSSRSACSSTSTAATTGSSAASRSATRTRGACAARFASTCSRSRTTSGTPLEHWKDRNDSLPQPEDPRPRGARREAHRRHPLPGAERHPVAGLHGGRLRRDGRALLERHRRRVGHADPARVGPHHPARPTSRSISSRRRPSPGATERRAVTSR